MIERIYKCDLCKSTFQREDLVPIRWNGSIGLVVADESTHGPMEKHLCRACIKGIKGFVDGKY
jgi:hypothetical protein